MCIAFSSSYPTIIAARPEKQIQHSPLKVVTNRLQKIIKSLLSNLKQIILYTAPPWWTPPPKIIKLSKKKAELAQKNLMKAFLPNKNLFMYTNGSEINEKVGALATTKTVTWNFFLSSTNLFTVYLEELYDILLRTGLASHVDCKSGRVFIYVNN